MGSRNIMHPMGDLQGGKVTRLNQKNTRVNHDENELHECHQDPIFHPARHRPRVHCQTGE
eukprot:7389207-Prymnesium_polylepis.3